MAQAMTNLYETLRRWCLVQLLMFCLFLIAFEQTHATEVTPSHVFQTSRIALVELEQVFAVQNLSFGGVERQREQRFPRHVWQKAREVLVKLEQFKERVGLTAHEIPPFVQREVRPEDVKRLADRILADVELVKKHLGVRDPIPSVSFKDGYQPTDVYNNMARISAMLDVLSSTAVKPSDVYRVIDTAVQVLRQIHQNKNPNIEWVYEGEVVEGQSPRDVFGVAISLLDKLDMLAHKQGYSIQGGVAKVQSRVGRIAPVHVLGVMNIILADVNAMAWNFNNMVAVKLAPHVEGKIPSDVYNKSLEAIALVDALL